MAHQLDNSRHTGAQIGHRQRLGLVEYKDAASHIVQFPAAGRAVGVQRLKKLHRRRHHHRHVPIFGGERLSIFRRAVPFPRGILRSRMMLQHIFRP